jgi:FMN reductase
MREPRESAVPAVPRILGLAGSLRQQSVSRQVLGFLMPILRREGADARVLDLRALCLPFCSGDRQDPYPDWPDVALLRRAVQESQGLVLVTPEYHGSVSGVLKNTLDLLDFPHLEGKVAGLISVLGGRSNSNALNDLRTILRWCRAWAIPEQIAVAESRRGLDAALAGSPELAERFGELARSLVRSTLRLAGDPLAPAGCSLFESLRHDGESPRSAWLG